MRRYLFIICLMMGCLGHMPPHYVYTHHQAGNSIKEISIYLDIRFKNDDLLLMGDAINQWNYALNGYIKLSIMEQRFDMQPEIIESCKSECWMVMEVDSNNTLVKSMNDNETLAWVNDIGGNRMFIIRDRIKSSWIEGISLHEMGHLLGAEHDNEHLMSSRFKLEDTRCIDYAALKEVAIYQGLNLEQLNYCVYES